MKLILSIIICSLIFLLSSSTSFALERIVNPGTSINSVITAALAGDVIRVRAGTYSGKVTINKQLTLEAYGDGSVWIDAGCVSTYPAGADNGVDSGITIEASNVVVKNLGVRNSRDAAILMDGRSATVSNVIIDNNTLENFDCKNTGPEYRAGVGMWYAGSGHRIINNTIDRRPGSNTAGNSNGIWTKSDTADPSGGGHYIANNIIRHVYDGIGGEKEDDARGGYDRNTTIENNTIDYCNDDGISVEGGTKNITVRNNSISHCAIGIANAPNLIGPVHFINNRITLGVPGDYGNVQCYKVGNFQPNLIPAGEVGADNGRAYYTGNICDLSTLPDQDSTGWGQTNSPTSSIIADGNQTNVTRWVIEIPNRVTGHQYSFNNNCLYSSDSTGRFVEFIDVIRNTDDSAAVAAMNATSWAEGNTASSNCAKGNITPTPTTPITPSATPTRTPTPQPGTPTPTLPTGTKIFTATLLPGNEVPSLTGGATGNGTLTLSSNNTTATVSINWTGFSSSVTGVHIHGPADTTQNAGVIFDFTPNIVNNQVSNIQITLTSTQLQQLQQGLWYINVHTTNNPNGAIRGQLMSSTTPTVTTSQKPGDCQPAPNGDGDVDIFDYNSLVSNFGSTTNLQCDFVNLGAIDIFDYNIIVGNFGT